MPEFQFPRMAPEPSACGETSATLTYTFLSGNKGIAYLTGFLAWMLLVSAFQVVNAKWGEMMEKGDRDVCYFNERCYRPYLGKI